MSPLKQRINHLSRIVIITLSFVSCKMADTTPNASSSRTKGFSSSSGGSVKNAAILMTSYGHTPSYRNYFENDLQNMKAVVSDPTGNYQFESETVSNATHQGLIDAIAKSAKLVSVDGTLFVYITAHGAVSGQIEPADQSYATFGYPEILEGIHKGRAGMPAFKRLFIVISACYSGSWLPTIKLDPAFTEYLAMTSVDENNLSGIGDATQAMKEAFASAKTKSNATMQSFINDTHQINGQIRYKAEPASLWNEPLVNSGAPNPTPTPIPGMNDLFYARIVDGSADGRIQLQISLPSGATPVLCLKSSGASTGCAAADQVIALSPAPGQAIAGRNLFQSIGDLPALAASRNLFNAVVTPQGGAAGQNIKFAISPK